MDRIVAFSIPPLKRDRRRMKEITEQMSNDGCKVYVNKHSQGVIMESKQTGMSSKVSIKL